METPQEFLKRYEVATNSHDFSQLAPVIHPQAIYWFTSGSFVGHQQIRDAMEKTWNYIRDETYSLSNVQILHGESMQSFQEQQTVALTYKYHWQGIIDGQFEKGEGRGTSVLVRNGGSWRVIHEHLSHNAD